jgi:hypothetical protein
MKRQRERKKRRERAERVDRAKSARGGEGERRRVREKLVGKKGVTVVGKEKELNGKGKGKK